MAQRTEPIQPSYLPAAAAMFTNEETGETVMLLRPYEALPIEELRRHAMGEEHGALLELGERYLFGWGGAEQNYETAYEYFKRAAELGVQDALCHLADYYIADDRGVVKRDEAEHLRLRTLAAESGSWQAMEKLAHCYEEGRFGAPLDHEKAYEWAVEAEKMIRVYWTFYNQPNCVDFKETYKLLLKAHTRVSCLLAHFCADGVGVTRDLDAAMRWLDSGEQFVRAATGLKAVPVFRQQKQMLEQRIKKDRQRGKK